jgi:hypothetical protein
MVALSSTLLVVHQICAAERDILFPLEVVLASFQNEFFSSTRSSLISFGILCSILWTGD